MMEDGSAELDNSMFNGERAWKNLACVLKKRLSLLNAEMRDLKCRGKNLNSNVSIAGRVNRLSMITQVGSPVAGANHGLTPPPPQAAAVAALNSNVTITGRVNRASMITQVGSPVAGPSHVLTSPPPQTAAAAVVNSSPNHVGNDWSFEYSAEMFRTPDRDTGSTFNWNIYFR